GQVGGPSPPKVMSYSSPAPVSDIPVLVAPSKIVATSLLGTFQMGFHFPGSLDLSVSPTQLRPKASIRDGNQGLQVIYPTDRQEMVTVTQVYFPKRRQWDLNPRPATWGVTTYQLP